MNNNNSGFIIGALVVVVLVLAFVVYRQTNQPKTPQQEIAHGVGQAIENAGDSMQRAAH